MSDERAVVLDTLDPATLELVRLAAVIAAGTEAEMRTAFAHAAPVVPALWVDELLLQSYLFSGFPRALNAAREWRAVSPSSAPARESDAPDSEADVDWRTRGEATCSAVYGTMYEKLRLNIRALHPALDESMLVEGYGRILGRPALDLARRELCIVAACAVTEQHRQLHSHLHGALNVGVSPAALAAAIDGLHDLLGDARLRSLRLLLARVVGK